MVYVLVHHVAWIRNLAVLFFYSTSPSSHRIALLVFLFSSRGLNSGLELQPDEPEGNYGMTRQMCNVFVQSFD